MINFLASPNVHLCDLDFGQFGERWQKPTRLLYRGLDLSSLAVQCQGTHMSCSHSKRPHIPLVGKDSAGMWWTRRAQPFAQLALQQLRGGKAG